VFVESEPHGIDGQMLINKLTTDLLEPANNKISMGSDFGTFTQNSKKDMAKIIGTQISEKITEEKASVLNQIINLSSSIELMSDEILATVKGEYITKTNFNTEILNLSSEFSQKTDEFLFKFTELQQDITSMGGQSDDKFVKIEKYIRFLNGDIVLGEAGNSNELRIKTDRISFMQSGLEIAYISNNKLTIKNAQINERLGLGNFAFIPRENGNLSFNHI
jgi:hypothetical protein